MLSPRDKLGWVASILLMFCAMPQVVQSWQQGHSNGLSVVMLAMWFAGTSSMLVFLYPERKQQKQVFCNYIINSCASGIILYFRVFGG